MHTARTIWGQSFDGTASIDGDLTCQSVYIGKGNEIWSSTDLYINQGGSSKSNVIICAIGGGNVGIGIYNPKSKLHVGGDILATGGITAYSSSDIRLKTDLRKLDYLGIIKAMGGTFGFAWKKDNTRSIGFIAQHVLHNPHFKDIVETDEKGYYKINYWSPKLIATAFGAIEQVGDEVTKLRKKVVNLEKRIKGLEKANTKLLEDKKDKDFSND